MGLQTVVGLSVFKLTDPIVDRARTRYAVVTLKHLVVTKDALSSAELAQLIVAHDLRICTTFGVEPSFEVIQWYLVRWLTGLLTLVRAGISYWCT